MIDNYFECEKYSGVDFVKVPIKKGTYDACTFEDCNFENVHASAIEFMECEFINCNFSNTIIKNTSFKEVLFMNCKLLGIKFCECDPFLLQMSFENCQLSLASFYQLKIPKTKFVHCNLEEVDFTAAHLQEAMFDNCNLKRAVFEDTHLEKSDFRSALFFSIHPNENHLKGAKFSKDNLAGLLQHYQLAID